MSYQVVARKWRPQRFDEVIGQDHITNTLKYAVQADRIAPVLLFTGIRGTGKTTLARIMVKSLNCENPETNGEPCNSCDNCLEIMAGKSPDVIEIDGASNNSVNDVRSIKENISYHPVKSKRKVYIIDEVHMLSNSAFNALLKTLEEPPEHVVFILATTDPQKIPTTVLSRCQRYDLHRLNMDQVVLQLTKILDSESLQYDKEGLYLIAKEGEGSMRDSQTILEQLITFNEGVITEKAVSSILGNSDKSILRGIVEAIALKKSQNAIKLVRNLYYSGSSVEKAAKDLLYIFHHILLYSNLNSTEFIETSEEEKKWIEQVSKMMNSADWNRLFDFWSKEYERIKNSDFAFMLLEVATVTASSFPTLTDFESLLDAVRGGVKHVAKDFPEVPASKEEEGSLSKDTAEKKNENILTEDKKETFAEGFGEIQEQDASEAIEIVSEQMSMEESENESFSEIPDEIPVGKRSWKEFLSSIQLSTGAETYIYNAIYSAKYDDIGNEIVLYFNPALKKAVEDIEESFRSKFDEYFERKILLRVVWDESEKLSQADLDEIEKQEKINKIILDLKNDKRVKELEEMGFSVKKISVDKV